MSRRAGTRRHAERRPGRAGPSWSLLAELPVLLLLALVLALLLKTFLVQTFVIPSESMVPTLEVGDRVLVNRAVYRFRDPQRGEVVVFRDDEPLPAAAPPSLLERAVDVLTSGLGVAADERDLIKRIVGLPGETVEVRAGVVHIDGEPLAEELAAEGGYLDALPLQDFGPVTVPAGSYFMMGDARNNSADSRSSLGTVAREDLIGRAFVRIWPPGRIGRLPIPGGEP